MKIAFYCDFNNQFKNEVKSLEEGNIGVGGTQYLFMLVVSNLQKKYNSEQTKYKLLANEKIKIKQEILSYEKVNDIKHALIWCEEQKYDYLVIRANDILSFEVEEIKKSKVSFILWAHNYIGNGVEELLYSQKNIAKLICVSKQQYLNRRNSIAYHKMTYINNCIGSYIDEKNEIESLKNKHHIYYIGAIEPAKGVHNVLTIFSKLAKRNPNMDLTIIGGMGNLRAKNIKLGEKKLSYPKYENFLCSIIKKNKIENKVKFLGVLDNETIRKIVTTEPGIGLISVSYPLMGETFCITALELESYGIPVVARDRKDGVRTAIRSGKTGYLKKLNRNIIKRILQMEEDEALYEQLSKNAICYAKEFSITKIVNKWHKMLNQIEEPDQNFTKTLTYKIKTKLHYNFITIQEFIIRFQTKILIQKYKKWMR